ncbi:MAG: hypothetical protein GF308_12295 [Candidatus Heimdallarchaeota archaeon]|nr:hypothetical protein [Candidatus Heimdallarchaeota archaeon]
MSDDELANLREKRKRELLKLALQKEKENERKTREGSRKKAKEREIRSIMIVNQVLEPEAIKYMNWLTEAKPRVAQTIRESIILVIHKRLLRRPLSKIDIMRLEREITGEGPKIRIKKRGKETIDLAEKVKRDKRLEKDEE